MIDWKSAPRRAVAPVLALAVALGGCGSDANLNIDDRGDCAGGKGPRIRGVVRMPNGKLAQRPDLLERFAAFLVAPVEAISGSVSPVGKGIEIQLVQLRPEDLAADAEPGVLERATTNGKGEFCIGLREGTDVDVCRYLLQVGAPDAGTRTRAFVYSAEEATDIDLYSDATVSVSLADLDPADLCAFSPDDIRAIRQAVLDAPGTVTGSTVAEVNAIAASLAAADPAVRAAVAAAIDGSASPPTDPRREGSSPAGAGMRSP